ncbi:diguanylate cyclase (GGDEF) domain-containing protein [Ruminococcus sp. YRD2003]|uniref:GGDEF domain-containing protein n=1 Tax=Ruminococcus sp. YRD2003 TaxID=1452313 RepID=UPI0008BAC7BA|nr:diguanylate cyclase (GGDEF) domain-containing protein [Ruminococcus flavefaciens]
MINFENVTLQQILDYIGGAVDAILLADQNGDRYRAISRKGIFKDLIAESGTYKDIVQKLWFHFNNSDKKIAEEYQVFIPDFGTFTGKYSQRLKLFLEGVTHIVQMTVFPVEGSEYYLIMLNELDESESIDEAETQQKVSTIQNIYLFSMCFDLVRDTTSSLSLTEVSEETMNSQISYTAWRQMIVNMIWKNDQPLFMERSDPAYLRSHFLPGQIESFDCQMQNLDGVYIWVKLIFSRMETTNKNDYRFVYMVQNIHDTTVSMKATLKHYEELSMHDSLTHIFNHGRIETELCNAVDNYRNSGCSAALLVLDIDHFKEVNDTYGHAIGDSTLVRLTEIIKSVMSGKNAVYGRWGGEEFAIVVYDTDIDKLNSITNELRTSVEKEEFPAVGLVTCSIGASLLNADDTFETWFDRADKAMYSAKTNGRNRVCIK